MRNVLEVGFETLHGAGFDKETLRGQDIGVFLGDAGTDWFHNTAAPTLTAAAFAGKEINETLYQGSQIGMRASRLSHLFGLKGTYVSIDTACSSSLVALAQANR